MTALENFNYSCTDPGKQAPHCRRSLIRIEECPLNFSLHKMHMEPIQVEALIDYVCPLRHAPYGLKEEP